MKRGDTLLANCVHKDSDGNPVNLATAGIEITSAVIDGAGARHDVGVTIKDQGVTPGGFVVESDSADWTPGTECQWDIRYAQNGRSFSTRTIRFALGGPVT